MLSSFNCCGKHLFSHSKWIPLLIYHCETEPNRDIGKQQASHKGKNSVIKTVLNYDSDNFTTNFLLRRNSLLQGFWYQQKMARHMFQYFSLGSWSCKVILDDYHVLGKLAEMTFFPAPEEDNHPSSKLFHVISLFWLFLSCFPPIIRIQRSLQNELNAQKKNCLSVLLYIDISTHR